MTKAILVLLSLAGGLLVATALTSRLYRIPSSGMEPTLHCPRPGAGCLGNDPDRIAVSRVLYRFRDPHRGDVVAFKTPPQAVARCGSAGTFVKRLIGLPGERWRVEKGFVFINGKRLKEPYVKPARRGSETLPERRIAKGSYVVLGDNRSQSCDSRVWGPLRRSRIVGPVIAVYWPPKRISLR